MKHHDVLTNLSCLAAADHPQAQRAEASDADHDPDRSIDSDEERDFADQGPLTDMDMEEDAEMLALLLKHMPSCSVRECELYSGRPKARCYPFNLQGHRFRERNRQVFYVI